MSNENKFHARSQFETFGEFLADVKKDSLARTGAYRGLDSTCPKLAESQLQRRAAAGGSEQVPGDGGFLVPPEFSGEIMKRMYNVGQVLNRTTPRLITKGNSYKYPQFDEKSRATGSRLGGVRVYTVNEADAATASKSKYELSEVHCNKIIGLMYATDELTDDATAFGQQMMDAFALEATFAIENYIVNGTGAGQPQGVLNSPALITIAKESGQSAATVVSANVEKMISSFWAPSYNNPDSVWLYNQGLLVQLSTLTTAVGTAGSESKLWQWRGDSESENMLAGIPAIASEYCAAPGMVGDLILADFSRYIFAVREWMRNELSIHIDFLSDQSAFRTVCRIGGQTIDHTAVTPLNSGVTSSSPFVALATRG